MKQSKKVKPRKIAFLLILLILLITFSCTLNNQYSIPNKKLNFPKTDYSSLILVDNNLIAFISDHSTRKIQFTIEGNPEIDYINPVEVSNCGDYSTRYHVAGAFPDGRIQLIKKCFTETGALTYIMAYDFRSKKLEPIIDLVPLGTGEINWNPNMTRGIVELRSGFASKTLYFISEDGFGPLDVTITDEGKSWSLSSLYPNFDEAKKLIAGDTGRADWSPDGKSIAFFASTEAMGTTGFDRFYVEYKLYIMDADNFSPILVLDNIHFPHMIEWSPDSKHIAFIGMYGVLKQKGIWLYSLDTKLVTNIDKGNFQDIIWALDNSNNIIAIKCGEDFECPEIIEYNLEEIITNLQK